MSEEKKVRPPTEIDKDVPMKTEPVAVTKVEAKAEEPVPVKPTQPPQPEEDPLWKIEDTKQLDRDGVPLIEKRGILLPENYWEYAAGKTPLTGPMADQRNLARISEIRRDPARRAMSELAPQYAPLSTSAIVGPPPKDVPEYVKDMANVKGEDEDLKDLDIPPYESWHGHPSQDVEPFLKQINGKVRLLSRFLSSRLDVLNRTTTFQIDPLFQRRAHLESERVKLWRESNQALLDLEIAVLDVKAAERRRQIASEQLDLAMEGRLGIDYDHSKPSISDRLDATPLSVLR